MTDIIIENIVKITAALLLMLIGVLGTYLTTLAAKRAETANVSEALRALTEAAKTTVGELQQTIVEPLKAAAADGKLTPDEIADLRNMLVAQTKQKMLPSAINCGYCGRYPATDCLYCGDLPAFAAVGATIPA